MSKREISKPIRIAVFMGKHTTGGIKSVIMNYYRHINRQNIQFDFFVDNDSPLKDYSDIKKLGGRVYEIPPTKNPIGFIISAVKTLKKEKYLIVHGYLNTLNVFPMIAGRIAGVPVRIAENLSTAHPGESKTKIKNLLKPFAKLFVTDMAANSKYAAEWLYGKKNLDKCKIIYNALDLDVYHYDENLRIKKRQELGIENNFVIGHIGRYEYQKNHDFLIDIFNEVHEIEPKSKLLLVGYGSLKEHIFKKIETLGLKEFVIDCGATENIAELYNAMDCFVLPSFYEGLPVVGIEAQAMDLPCVFSSEITKETKILDCFEFVDLSNDAETWADKILAYKDMVREDVSEQVTKHGYNIIYEADNLEKFYFNCLNSIKSKE